MTRLAALDHAETRVRVEAERGFLARIEGGCQVPIAGRAIQGGRVFMRALVASLDGTQVIRGERTGPAGRSAPDGRRARRGAALEGRGRDPARVRGQDPGLAAPKR